MKRTCGDLRRADQAADRDPRKGVERWEPGSDSDARGGTYECSTSFCCLELRARTTWDDGRLVPNVAFSCSNIENMHVNRVTRLPGDSVVRNAGNADTSQRAGRSD